MNRLELKKVMAELPRVQAIVETTNEVVANGTTIPAHNYGYIVDTAWTAPTVCMVTGPELGCVSIPLNSVKFIGYETLKA